MRNWTFCMSPPNTQNALVPKMGIEPAMHPLIMWQHAPTHCVCCLKKNVFILINRDKEAENWAQIPINWHYSNLTPLCCSAGHFSLRDHSPHICLNYPIHVKSLTPHTPDGVIWGGSQRGVSVYLLCHDSCWRKGPEVRSLDWKEVVSKLLPY